MKHTLKKNAVRAAGITMATATLLVGSIAFANPASDLTQSITAGTLTTDILNASRATVASPTAAMSAKAFSFDCYAGGSASTGSLGTNSERLYVINPDGADAGWSLTLAATDGATDKWENSGATKTYDFNDPAGSTAGCGDGGDADSIPGQLTVNANAGTLTTDCVSCVTTNVTKGSSTGFNQGTTDSVPILTAAAGSDDVWRGYLTGASLSQTIPAEQGVDSYTINLTLTVSAT